MMELLEDGKKKKRKFSHSLRQRQLPQGGGDMFRLKAERQPAAALNYTFDCNKKKQPSDAKPSCIKMQKIIRNLGIPEILESGPLGLNHAAPAEP